jgi:hypothetical protein
MSEKPLPFVITDRRKFTTDGQPREGAELSPTSEPEPEAKAETHSANVVEMKAPAEPEPAPAASSDAPEQASAAEQAMGEDEEMPPAPTAEQMEQSLRAFEATAERLDLAVRAANPGAEHPPAISFESLVQSVYMQAVLQLGGGTPQGEQPQVDIFGARQSIAMLGILAEKTTGNLSPREDLLLSSALFELRLAFLEMTQALARSAQQRNPGAPGTPPAPGGRPGPNLVR